MLELDQVPCISSARPFVFQLLSKRLRNSSEPYTSKIETQSCYIHGNLSCLVCLSCSQIQTACEDEIIQLSKHKIKDDLPRNLYDELEPPERIPGTGPGTSGSVAEVKTRTFSPSQSRIGTLEKLRLIPASGDVLGQDSATVLEAFLPSWQPTSPQT